ncbi:14391_t:CDS:2, partial [Cetraspora pellucida]
DKKVNTSKNSTMKSSSIVETSLAKNKELDCANEVENNIKTEKVLKLLLLSKGKDNKETYANFAKMLLHLANAVTDAAFNNMTKEASNSGLTENSDSSEVEEDNNMEEKTLKVALTRAPPEPKSKTG